MPKMRKTDVFRKWMKKRLAREEEEEDNENE